MIDETEQMQYETMFMRGNKDVENKNALVKVELDMDKKRAARMALNDSPEKGANDATDEQILNAV